MQTDNQDRDMDMKDAAIFVVVYFSSFCIAGTIVVYGLRAINALFS